MWIIQNSDFAICWEVISVGRLSWIIQILRFCWDVISVGVLVMDYPDFRILLGCNFMEMVSLHWKVGPKNINQ